jgi:hypothetical protein
MFDFQDGIIDAYDVPLEYDLEINGGNANGIIDETEAEYGNWLGLGDQNADG